LWTTSPSSPSTLRRAGTIFHFPPPRGSTVVPNLSFVSMLRGGRIIGLIWRRSSSIEGQSYSRTSRLD
ncbi:hypothetical protein AB1N83_014023, partial [Pleurotus pulmonarius]